MKLIGSLTSPFVRKIRVQLLEKEIPFQFVPENVWEEGTKIMDHNPLGKIPCLILDSGQAVFDSTVISGTLEYMMPTNPLLPTDPHKRALVRTMESLGSGMNDAAVAILLEHKFHEGEAVSKDWLNRQYSKIHHSLEWLDIRLKTTPGAFLLEQFSLADISVGCALMYLDFRRPELQWRKDLPALAEYADRLADRPSFEGTRPPV
jgi:glutathione S-transferase